MPPGLRLGGGADGVHDQQRDHRQKKADYGRLPPVHALLTHDLPSLRIH
jgi:hypothetical protein